MATSRSDSGYGRGRRRTPSTTLKTAVVAPIPTARVSTERRVKLGARRRLERARRKRERRVSIAG